MYEYCTSDSNRATIRLTGELDAASTAPTLRSLQREVRNTTPLCLAVDLEVLPYFDDFAALLLVELKEQVQRYGGRLEIIDPRGISDTILKLVGFSSFEDKQALRRQRSASVFVRIGDATLRVLFNLRFSLSFIGSIILAFLRVVRHPKSLRMGDTVTCMEKTGVDALPIVGLISFLLGLIMAFMSSLQLKQFGATIYVASLVALAMVSELGPIMTAIVVAGRSGSAFAAEIGTMKISEEVDALFTMGFDPTLFLAIPRIIASVLVVPILTLFSNIFAITGGLFIGIFMLDLTPGSYMAQTVKALSLFEVLWGMTKSAIFAVIISSVACLRGFQARGGSAAVGNAATSSVVTSIFLIILFDSLFAVIRSYW